MSGRTTLGTLLHSADHAEVLARFTHRFTQQHTPQWAKGTNYKPQFKDDADWLANSYFPVKRDGRLDARHTSCRSNPTWPEGKGVNSQKGIDW